MVVWSLNDIEIYLICACRNLKYVECLFKNAKDTESLTGFSLFPSVWFSHYGIKVMYYAYMLLFLILKSSTLAWPSWRTGAVQRFKPLPAAFHPWELATTGPHARPLYCSFWFLICEFIVGLWHYMQYLITCASSSMNSSCQVSLNLCVFFSWWNFWEHGSLFPYYFILELLLPVNLNCFSTLQKLHWHP